MAEICFKVIIQDFFVCEFMSSLTHRFFGSQFSVLISVNCHIFLKSDFRKIFDKPMFFFSNIFDFRTVCILVCVTLKGPRKNILESQDKLMISTCKLIS